MRWPDGISRDTVRRIVSDVAVEVDVTAMLLDRDLQPVRDLTDVLDPEGSRVVYDADLDVDTSCTLILADRLDWPQARVRLAMSLTSPSGSLSVGVGTFRLGHPTQRAGQDWEVTGYDPTSQLTYGHGTTVEAQQGEQYIARARQIALARGLDLQVAGSGDTRTLPRDRWWPLDTPTYTILADLLVEGGFTPPWCDSAGRLRTELDRPLSEAAIEHTYDADDDRTTVAEDRELDEGLDDIPNRLVAITDSPLAWAAVEGDGMVTLDDTADQDRTGEVRPQVVRLEASDQQVLASRARIEFDRLRRPGWTVELSSAPHPLHDRRDVVRVVDGELGIDRRGVVTGWTLPLDGSDVQVTVGALHDVG